MEISILGCGSMGSAMARALAKVHTLHLYDKNIDKARALADELNQTAYASSQQAVAHSQVIIVGVKPQIIEVAAQEIADHITQDHLVISVAAGIPVGLLEKLFGQVPIVRCMPNIACTYGEGMIGLVDTGSYSLDIIETVEDALEPLGKLLWLSEDHIEALTALSGSGLAFSLVMIESMVDAAVSMGMTAAQAMPIVLQMLKGCVTLLEKSGKAPGELKWQVTSPSGTTIAGIRALEQHGVRSGIMETFLAANDRAYELQ